MDAKNNTTAPDLRTTFDDLGTEYAMEYTDHAFEPEFTKGDRVVFSLTKRHEAGDVVALWLRPEALRGRPQVSVWRVINALGCSVPFTPHPDSEVHPVLIVQSAIDGKGRAIRAEDILGVHPKIGVFYGERIHRDADQGEKEDAR